MKWLLVGSQIKFSHQKNQAKIKSLELLAQLGELKFELIIDHAYLMKHP